MLSAWEGGQNTRGNVVGGRQGAGWAVRRVLGSTLGACRRDNGRSADVRAWLCGPHGGLPAFQVALRQGETAPLLLTAALTHELARRLAQRHAPL